jgi:hypothetical protein
MTGKATYGNTVEQQVWDYFKANPGKYRRDMLAATGMPEFSGTNALHRLVSKRQLTGKGHTWLRAYTAQGERPGDNRGWALNDRRGAKPGRNPPPILDMGSMLMGEPSVKRPLPPIHKPTHALDICWGLKSSGAYVGGSEDSCVNDGGTLRPESEAA